MSAILGFIEALQRELYGELNDRQMKSIMIVEESTQHLLSLIKDILDVAKLEAGKLELEVGPILMANVSQSSIRLVEQTAFEKEIKISTNLDEQRHEIIADERSLKQILVNLLSNAVKFTPEKGEVGLVYPTTRFSNAST